MGTVGGITAAKVLESIRKLGLALAVVGGVVVNSASQKMGRIQLSLTTTLQLWNVPVSRDL